MFTHDQDTPREARVPGRKESVTGKVAGAKGAAGRKKTKYKVWNHNGIGSKTKVMK